MLHTTNLLLLIFHICNFLSIYSSVHHDSIYYCMKGVYRKCNILHDNTVLLILKLWEMCFTTPCPAKTKCYDLKWV